MVGEEERVDSHSATASILIVEDEAMWQGFYRELLEDSHKLTFATTYREGVAALQRQTFDLAIVDPCLTLTCPKHITAASGMDALTHAIEIYTNKFAVPVVDYIMLDAIRLAWENLAACVHNGSDLAARTGMAMASFYAG